MPTDTALPTWLLAVMLVLLTYPPAYPLSMAVVIEAMRADARTHTED